MMAPSLAVRSLAIFPVFLTFYFSWKRIRRGPSRVCRGCQSRHRRVRARRHASWFSRAATSEAAVAVASAESIDFIAVSMSVLPPVRCQPARRRFARYSRYEQN